MHGAMPKSLKGIVSICFTAKGYEILIAYDLKDKVNYFKPE